MKQSMQKLGIEKILSSTGMGKEEILYAQMLLTAKAIHPSSELETQLQLHENSATKELYNKNEKVSRYRLYKAATQMYDYKKILIISYIIM